MEDIYKYLNISHVDKRCNELEFMKYKIKSINNFNINTFVDYVIIFKNKFITADLNKYAIDSVIRKRIHNYFIKQHSIYNIGRLKSIVQFQYLIVTYCNKLICDIIPKPSIINYTAISSSLSYHDNKQINNIINTYLNHIKTCSQIVEKPIIQELQLKKFIERILSKLILFNSNEIIVYGSYTCYNINPTIHYNDIDIYHIHAYKFMVFFMVILNFIIGYDTHVFSIPYITGHISLKYKNFVLVDCICIPEYIVHKLPKHYINNIDFINTGMQFLNNIRMNVEIFRSSSINDQTISKYELLLNYFIFNSKFDVDRLNYWINRKLNLKDLPYKILNNCFIFDINALIPNGVFDTFYVLFDDPETIFSKLKSVNGVFSKRFYAFLNEIFFETRDEYVGGYENIIDESKFKLIKRSSIEASTTFKNKSLIFSNLITSIYISVSDNVIDISKRNICSILATYTLYNFLHNRTEYALECYYILLSLLYDVKEDITIYDKVDRYKIRGNHIELSFMSDKFRSIYAGAPDNTNDFITYTEYVNSNIY